MSSPGIVPPVPVFSSDLSRGVNLAIVAACGEAWLRLAALAIGRARLVLPAKPPRRRPVYACAEAVGKEKRTFYRGVFFIGEFLDPIDPTDPMHCIYGIECILGNLCNIECKIGHVSSRGVARFTLNFVKVT